VIFNPISPISRVLRILDAPSEARAAAYQAAEAREGAKKANTQMDRLLGLLIQKGTIDASEANQIRMHRR
jgi:hypothetical protein